MAHVAGYFIIIAYLFQLSGGNLILTQEEGEEEEGKRRLGKRRKGILVTVITINSINYTYF